MGGRGGDVAPKGAASSRLAPARRQDVLGNLCPGPDALDAVLQTWPATPPRRASSPPSWPATSWPTTPPPALVARLAADFLRTGGDLPSLYRTLVLAPKPGRRSRPS
jgi:hypothetical protein